MRHVLLHYHIYKNAGSSVDQILESSFQEAWSNFDGPTPDFYINQDELENLLRNRPHLKAMSSHQTRLPLPKLEETTFHPILLIRHPALRAASVYRFERSRDDQHPRTLSAQAKTFGEWLEHQLTTSAGLVIRNSQTGMLAFSRNKRPARRDEHGRPAFDLDRAKGNLDECPFVGVVELFDVSIEHYDNIYAPYFPTFSPSSTHVNVTDPSALTPEEKLEQLRHDVGDRLYEELLRQNHQDLELYRLIRSRFREIFEAESRRC